MEKLSVTCQRTVEDGFSCFENIRSVNANNLTPLLLKVLHGKKEVKSANGISLHIRNQQRFIMKVQV